MSIIQERTAEVERARAAVKDHCMCAKMTEAGGYIVVIYPEGDFPTHGCRTSYADGKAAAFRRLLPVMERHWIAGGIN